jgi:ferritin-like metal-binding protein YciE
MAEQTKESVARKKPAAPRGRRSGPRPAPAAEEATEQLDAARRQYAEAKEYLQDAHRQAGQVKEELDEAHQQLEVARKYVAATVRESQEARLEYQEAEQAVEAARRHVLALRDELPQAEREWQQFRARFEETRRGYAQAEEYLDAAREYAFLLMDRFEVMQRQLAETQGQLGTIRTQVEEDRLRQEQLRQAIRDAESRHEETRQQAESRRPAPLPSNGTAAAERRGQEDLGDMIYARLSTEDRQDRLVRYLNDAWSVEKELVETLGRMAREVIDPELRALFEEHREQTRRQQEALEARLQALGHKPAGGKGFFNRMVAGIWGALHSSPPDDFDQTTQDLMKGYATENFEMAMYEALESYARRLGDTETAELARRHGEEERAAAEKLWPLIAPVAARPAEVAELLASRS